MGVGTGEGCAPPTWVCILWHHFQDIGAGLTRPERTGIGGAQTASCQPNATGSDLDRRGKFLPIDKAVEPGRMGGKVGGASLEA